MKNPIFKTKAGRLTHYALTCGYREKYVRKDGIELMLWFEGGIIYHVRAYDSSMHRRIFWEGFETLTEARRYFDKAKTGILRNN